MRGSPFFVLDRGNQRCISLLAPEARLSELKSAADKDVTVRGRLVSYQDLASDRYAKIRYWERWRDIDYMNLAGCPEIAIVYEVAK
ncbi:MAG: hypothetical protein V4574_18575 [Pseudomonadota bacterium]